MTYQTASRRKIFFFALCVWFLALGSFAEAQQPGKLPRIGFLQRRAAPTPAYPDPLWDAFLKGLRELGYVDGKNIKIEHRYAQGRSDRLDALIAEFVQPRFFLPATRRSARPTNV
jgi:putative ABC transport system substrate-binding protein